MHIPLCPSTTAGNVDVLCKPLIKWLRPNHSPSSSPSISSSPTKRLKQTPRTKPALARSVSVKDLFAFAHFENRIRTLPRTNLSSFRY